MKNRLINYSSIFVFVLVLFLLFPAIAKADCISQDEFNNDYDNYYNEKKDSISCDTNAATADCEIQHLEAYLNGDSGDATRQSYTTNQVVSSGFFDWSGKKYDDHNNDGTLMIQNGSYQGGYNSCEEKYITYCEEALNSHCLDTVTNSVTDDEKNSIITAYTTFHDAEYDGCKYSSSSDSAYNQFEELRSKSGFCTAFILSCNGGACANADSAKANVLRTFASFYCNDKYDPSEYTLANCNNNNGVECTKGVNCCRGRTAGCTGPDDVSSNSLTLNGTTISINKSGTITCEQIKGITDFFKDAFFTIEIVASVLLVVLSLVDYAKVVMGDSDKKDEGMKKANKHLFTRIIIIVVLVLLPIIVKVILNNLNSTCYFK